ncbi:Acetoin utilization deacetylase AcuC [Arboricoccus pini]|uniref:Acetoin utilization deacetylase AcuC n=1 Tax=Arboricoccus pini TaxID=1963835 RepID=A0A212QNM4_9PROT|nr:histone deacetylase family protein [Arboricoccus pini]SNB60818.1 Acetoin utilization deacetylase AcuC [Arboricoccus pini]
MLLLTHRSGLGHQTGPGHPECPGRLEAVLAALEESAGPDWQRREAPAATSEQIGRVHPPEFQERLAKLMPAEGLSAVDGDTIVSPGSLTAAIHAAGACCAAVEALRTGETNIVFCATRPPGHHAEPARAMGFCLYNQIAIAAAHALASGDFQRVAIVDFDVHHGNGTQATFWNEPRVFYASIHQTSLFPHSGRAAEKGAHGTILNLPLPAGTGGAGFRAVVEGSLLPAIDRFAPELLLISAGFDAHVADPLADLMLEEDDFAWITSELRKLALTHAGGRIVSTLEGGYDIDALARSVVAHLEGLT